MRMGWSNKALQATAAARSVLAPGGDSLLSGFAGVPFPAAVPALGRSMMLPP